MRTPNCIRVALILLVALAANACTGGDGSVSETTTSPLTTTTATTTTTTATTAPLSSLAWSRVPHDEAILGRVGPPKMLSVTAGGPGLVAVGSEGPNDHEDAAVWTSKDGMTWSRVANDEAIFGGEDSQEMVSVTAGGPGLVAVGSDGAFGEVDVAVWNSSDGITWSRVPHDESVFGGEGFLEMVSVTAGGPGLVAVGGEESEEGIVAAVWTSPDGITWSRVAHDEAIFGGEGLQAMVSVTAGGPGLVAVGYEISADDWDDLDTWVGVAAVWTSSDGITWSRVPHDVAVFGGEGFPEMMSVTAGGPGLVAVGRVWSDDVSDAAAWTSPNGITWSRVAHDEAVFGNEEFQSMVSVTASGPGLVAVGSGSFGEVAVWTSPDGITWSRVVYDVAVFRGEGFPEVNSVTAGGPGLVAVGSEGLSDDEHAAVWTSPDGITWSRVPHDEAALGGEQSPNMNSVTAAGPGLVAVGSEGRHDYVHAAVWTSRDGITWSRVPHDETIFGEDGDGRMVSVTTGGPGVVAVGWAGSGGDSDAAVWTSPDGITWSRVPHDEAVFGGENSQSMASVTVGGPGLVAVGAEFDGYGNEGGRDDAAVWTSPDGITWSRVPHDEAVFGGEGIQRMNSVTAGGPGLVAVGQDTGELEFDAAVWTSVDGTTWSRVPHDEAVFGGEDGQEMASVTAGGPGLVAVGTDDSGDFGDAAVWTSPDGITWSRVPHDEAVFGGDRPFMESVTTVGHGLVAVGGFSDAVVWTSVDGITWSRVPHDEAVFGGAIDQRMNSVTAGAPAR